MQIGDKVKHKNVYIQGEVVEIDEQQNLVHVKCEGGTYYDGPDQWAPADVVEEEEQEHVEDPQA